MDEPRAQVRGRQGSAIGRGTVPPARHSALQQLDDIELPEEGEDTEEEWKKIVPAVKAALFEAKEQAAIDREEIETLWWMFAAFSEL